MGLSLYLSETIIAKANRKSWQATGETQNIFTCLNANVLIPEVIQGQQNVNATLNER